MQDKNKHELIKDEYAAIKNEIKTEYEAIEIPAELKEAIQYSFELARKREIKNRRIRRIFLTAVAVMVILFVAVNSHSVIAGRMYRIPIAGDVFKVITVRGYTDEPDSDTAIAKTPTIKANVKQIVAQATSGQYQEDKERETDGTMKQFESWLREDGYDISADGVVCEVINNNQQVISIAAYKEIDGAAPSIGIYHFSKPDGEQILLKDLFIDGEDYIDVLSKCLIDQIAHLEDVAQAFYLHVPADAADILNGKLSFYINDKGELILVFNPYQIADESLGILEFVIPPQQISDILCPERLI